MLICSTVVLLIYQQHERNIVPQWQQLGGGGGNKQKVIIIVPVKELEIILWLVDDQLLSFNIFLILVSVGQTNTDFKGLPSVLTGCFVVS